MDKKTVASLYPLKTGKHYNIPVKSSLVLSKPDNNPQ